MKIPYEIKKVKIELPYVPAIPLLGIYPKEIKSHSLRDICTPMFIVALFTIAKIWKQFKCSWTDEYIRKCEMYKQCHIIQL